jgi:hypothetical protein
MMRKLATNKQEKLSVNDLTNDLAFKSLIQKLNPKYSVEVAKLQDKLNSTELELLSIKDKIKVCLELLHFFNNWFKKPEQILKTGQTLMSLEKSHWEGIRLGQFRQFFESICETLVMPSIPMSFKLNYEALLRPSSKFTWKTLEYFAGLMKIPPKTEMVHINIKHGKYTNQVHEYFKYEYLEREKIVEAAIETTIIPEEVDKFIEFLSFLETNEKDLQKQYKPAELKKKYPQRFAFPGIYAVTKRVIDTYSLYELSLLTSENYIEFTNRLYIPAAKEKNYQGFFNAPLKLKPFNEPLSKKAKFYLLQRLYRLGELITGKHLQAKIINLDPSINWDAIITIRNTINHQEEPRSDSYQKVQDFLADEELVLNVELDLLELRNHIYDIIGLRYENTGALLSTRSTDEQVYKDFWQIVLKEETADDAASGIEDEEPIKPTYYSPTLDEISVFRSGLKENLSREQTDQVEAVLAGERILTTEERGRFAQEVLIGKDVDKDLQKQCSAILAKMMTVQKPTQEELQKQEQARQIKKAAKEIIRQVQLGNNISHLRRLAANFKKKTSAALGENGYMEASIKYLEEVKLLLKEIPGGINTGPHKKSFFEQMAKDKVYKGAFEYCISQALAMIEKARELSDLDTSCKYFKINGQEFKKLRNWVVHGNALLDFFAEDFKDNLDILNVEQQNTPLGMKLSPLNDFRNIILYPIVIHMVLFLLPQLENALLTANSTLTEIAPQISRIFQV